MLHALQHHGPIPRMRPLYTVVVFSVCFPSSIMTLLPGLEWGRRAAGMARLSAAATFTLLTENRTLMLIYLMLIYGPPAFQQPGIWAGCMDIGRNCSLPVRGFMNAAGQAGAFPPVLFGYLTMHSKPAQA
jgi:hypothetical protein